MTPETLSAAAGALLSLGAAYVPGFSTWFAGLDSIYKRLVMLALLALTAAGSLALACSGWWPETVIPGETGPGLPGCDQPGAAALLRAFIAALTANQAAYALGARRSGDGSLGGSDYDLVSAVDRLFPPRQD